MAVISAEMVNEIERRKENIRRVWDYKRVDHIPIMLTVASNPWGYTTQEHFLDSDKQFQLEFEKVKRSLELVPDDYIPSMRPDVGCDRKRVGGGDCFRGQPGPDVHSQGATAERHRRGICAREAGPTSRRAGSRRTEADQRIH